MAAAKLAAGFPDGDDNTMKRTKNPGRSTPAPKRGRPVGDHKAKRAELLEAAMHVIAQDGFAAASLRKVAQRAGVTTGAVTYYFANKEEMITAIAERLFDKFDEQMVDPSHDPLDIRATTEQFLTWTNASDVWHSVFQMIAHARHEPAFAAVMQRRNAQYHKRLTTVVEQAQKLGRIRDDIAANLLADQLMAMSDGWLMLFPIDPERFKPRRIKLLLDAVGTLIAPVAAPRR